MLILQAYNITIRRVDELDRMGHFTFQHGVQHLGFVFMDMLCIIKIKSKNLGNQAFHNQEAPYFVKLPNLFHANVRLAVHKFQ